VNVLLFVGAHFRGSNRLHGILVLYIRGFIIGTKNNMECCISLDIIQLSPLLECDPTVCLPEKSKVTRELTIQQG
jgi:hypothetical protein